MSETIFNAYEALRIATEMERDGLAFYEALAAAVSDVKVRKLSERFAREEKDHIRRFQEMIDAERLDNAWSLDDLQLLDDYLNATVRRGVFPGKAAAAKIGESVDNPSEALLLAIHMENMTVEYYSKLRDTCTYDTGKKAFAQLVEEEKKHAASLEEVRAALS